MYRMAISYDAWDQAIESAIAALPEAGITERTQQFLRRFPDALSQFRSKLAKTVLVKPLAEFQEHPTYLLRFLLAEWKDEETKTFRNDLNEIMTQSTMRIANSQKWRNGAGENWSRWGHNNMDELYENYRTSAEQEQKLNDWFFSRFLGLDVMGHPLHYDLIATTHEDKLALPMAIRRVLNNEHTLRSRIVLLNPPPESVRNGTPILPGSSRRADVLTNPILGCTWILDARKLSIWYASSIFKLANVLIDNAIKLTSAHYPEQGYRSRVINLGVAFGTMYNVLIKITPPTTQATTKCYIGNEALPEIVGSWEKVPEMFKKSGVTRLTPAEEDRFEEDLGPFAAARRT